MIYPSVAGGSLGFASFATGIGSIFSTEMGFGSAVISRLHQRAEHDRGRASRSSNGEIQLQNHALQGAERDGSDQQPHQPDRPQPPKPPSRLDAGSNGGTDYVMTVSGPVAAPAMSIKGR